MARAPRPKLTKAQQAKASAKIRHLHETEPDMPHAKKVAMALNMARRGQLVPRGAYKPKAKVKVRR